MDYEERKQNKIDRYRTYAVNARKRSVSYRSRGESVSSFIPFGQPILVGHHSERKHRRDIERLNNFTRREIEEDKKSEYWERKADTVENSTAISKHDPKAITKLREK